LVGFAVLYVPQPGDGEDLSVLLTKVDAAAHTSANFKICIVRPQWRGRGLQVLLGKHLGREARARGIDLLCATASPYNKPSVHSLLALGYQADHILTKYGYERMLFYCVNFDIWI
jgi:GNAT superfamily N-acetyltransferase